MSNQLSAPRSFADLPKVRLGVDLGGTKIEIIALDMQGRSQLRHRVSSPRDDYPATITTIRDLVLDAETRIGARGSVGIGIPGALSRHTGLVKNANSTWLIGRPLQQDLETALARPVRLANDANCLAVSEAVDGAGMGAAVGSAVAVVFAAILGTGVGAGIAIDGRAHEGPNAIAGEWGHNPLPWPGDDERPGDRCYCGRSGCLETFLSGPSLERAYERGAGTRRPAAEIVDLAERGDGTAEAVLRRYEDRLARGLAGVINTLDPGVIVLGGGLSNIERFYRTVPALWPRYVFSDAVDTPLKRAVHGDSSGVRGAAWLWRENGARPEDAS